MVVGVVAEVLKLLHHRPLCLHDLVSLSHIVNPKQASVAVLRVEGHGTLHQRVLAAVVAREDRSHLRRGVDGARHRRVEAPEHRLHHHGGEGIRVVILEGLKRCGNVSEPHLVVADTDVGASEPCGRLLLNDRGASGLLGSSGESLCNLSSEGIVVDIAGSNNHHPRSDIVGLDVVDDVVTSHVLDVLLRSKDRSPEGRRLVCSVVQVVEDNLLLNPLDNLHLLEDGVLLALDRGGVKSGVEEHLRENVDGLVCILLEYVRIVHSLLPGSVCVQAAAHVLDLELQLPLRLVLGSLEEHVLKKVGAAVALGRLVTTT
mmetsp:Transcript_27630/g.64170  ORF Transcript_27630/g.64170 Transcript_27630/m.64170 type:complete len:316 (-) Transcript_27630:344-1291(-)